MAPARASLNPGWLWSARQVHQHADHRRHVLCGGGGRSACAPRRSARFEATVRQRSSPETVLEVAPGGDAGAGRTAVPVRHAGRHRGAVPARPADGGGQPRPPDQLPARGAAAPARDRLDDRCRTRPGAQPTSTSSPRCTTDARADRSSGAGLPRQPLLSDAAAAAGAARGPASVRRAAGDHRHRRAPRRRGKRHRARGRGHRRLRRRS